MSDTKPSPGAKISWLCTLAYFASYMTRINFSAVVQAITTDTGLEKSILSTVLVCLSVTYGIGQVVNGFIGDHIRPQTQVLAGLIIATVCNVALPFCVFSIPLMCVIWGINGFSQAMLWPPISKILICTYSGAAYGPAVVRTAAGSSAATIVTYLLAPVVLLFASWKTIFWIAAAIAIAISVMWYFSCKQLPLQASSTENSNPKPSPDTQSSPSHRLPATVWIGITLAMVAIIAQGMLRDGVSSWMPSFLAEQFGMTDSLSILLTVSLAIFSMLSFYVFSAFYQRFFQNEALCAGVIFFMGLVFAFLLFLFPDRSAILSVLLMALITAAMHGVNLMLISYIPRRFALFDGSRHLSTISGVLNACTYVGSAICTYGTAKLAEGKGWQFTFGGWALIALAGVLFCLIAAFYWHRAFLWHKNKAELPSSTKESEKESDPA